MAENHVGVLIVLISATEAGVCDLDENLIGADLLGSCRLDDLALLGAFEDGELNHFGCRILGLQVATRELRFEMLR